METINVIFILCIVFGFILMVYALILAQKNVNEKNEIFTIEEGIKKIKVSINEADKTIDELNRLAEQVFLQFDEKKKDFLFLYDLIEQKEQSIASKVNIVVDKDFLQNEDANSGDNSSSIKSSIKYENPLLKQILEMEQKGMSISEISKALNVGQGEIELILTLGKE